MSKKSIFDHKINRIGTGCEKWDQMEGNFGIPTPDGLAMWVADTDFLAPEPVQNALQALMSHGVYGYHGDETQYLEAVVWWMQERHGWKVDPASIFSVHGLVNGFALCVDTFSNPGDAVVLFTPVYHAFERVLQAADREITTCPLVNKSGRYELDLEDAAARLTGREKILAICSPHNPGGRVWRKSELEALAEFARRHDLLILSDEIHHDLVFPGHHHIPMATIAGIKDRLVMMTAATKTFNIAGCQCGNVIIDAPELRKQFARRLVALGVSGNVFGVELTRAAYSPQSLQWLEEQISYIEGNRELFDLGVNKIPGVSSMHLESTYLAWVDFSETGLNPDEIRKKVHVDARIAANTGPNFGRGGSHFMRFNLGTHRSVASEAVDRLHSVFNW
ncbi:PatB family C-S lyase [Shimia sp.]|uniref:MalY/PatB family protein n=1 Tax=Shimia sp. TaxID=1954381 RepID=UPI003296FFF1